MFQFLRHVNNSQTLSASPESMCLSSSLNKELQPQLSIFQPDILQKHLWELRSTDEDLWELYIFRSKHLSKMRWALIRVNTFAAPKIQKIPGSTNRWANDVNLIKRKQEWGKQRLYGHVTLRPCLHAPNMAYKKSRFTLRDQSKRTPPSSLFIMIPRESQALIGQKKSP